MKITDIVLEGSVCPECGGTGMNKERTIEYHKEHPDANPREYIMCRSCNGNGNDSYKDFMSAKNWKPPWVSDKQK